ncbi:MauE/DoxX family redox-associated membrane protein [Marivita sp. S2033]|uniref:MauE/DoxX family redox-associated membrane protein n=1 Tax=Marivita sp. S2033 TaxID=3373187 RepID=UPI003982A570
MSDRVDTPQEARSKSSAGRAVLYRMAMPGHLCPFGLKSLSLLKRKGFEITDNLLTTREETDAFMAKHDVDTTPQTFIEGERIGGYTDLKEYFGYTVKGEDDTTYAPVIAIFASTALMALAIVINLYDGFPVLTWLKWFFATSMVALAIQKLQDVESFVSGFLGYDLLARRYVPYGYAYPFGELYAGVGMMALIGTQSWLIWLVAPVAIFIGTIGAVSVIKAVYIDKRELTCACVGGGSNVPLGFLSLTENLVMLAMGIWMLGLWFAA